MAAHPQQYVIFDGRPEPIENVVDILRSTSKAKDEHGQSAEVFEWLGRRGIMIEGERLQLVAPKVTTDPQSDRIARYRAQLDRCLKVQVTR